MFVDFPLDCTKNSLEKVTNIIEENIFQQYITNWLLSYLYVMYSMLLMCLLNSSLFG